MAVIEEGRITCDDALLRSGFVQVPVLILQSPDLGAGAKLVYGVLLWYLWKKERYPGHRVAAEQFGIAERSLKRYMAELDTAGLVATERSGLGETNSYHLPDPRAILAYQPGHGGTSEGPKRPNKKKDTVVLDSNNEDETASLSLAFDIAHQYGSGAVDQKALTTSLSKYPAVVLVKVQEQAALRVAEGNVKNPSAYANRLAQVFAEAEKEASLAQAEEEQQTFDMILSTAVFEHSNGRSDEDLRRALLELWPSEGELIEKVIELVIG